MSMSYIDSKHFEDEAVGNGKTLYDSSQEILKSVLGESPDTEYSKKEHPHPKEELTKKKAHKKVEAKKMNFCAETSVEFKETSTPGT